MELETIEQLDKWMSDNCYNDYTYQIGNRNISEGFGVDKLGSLFAWFYTERGEKQNLTYFQTEKEIVQFAFEKIKDDFNASRHCIGFIKEKMEVEALIKELKKRNIEFFRDEILYLGPNNLVIRIFVFGCDINKAKDLKEKYYNPK